MMGKTIGHYRILEKIGTGGMGDVFRARDERLGREVAIKLIKPASSGNRDHLRRFEQEARAAAALNHPNILAIYDVGFEGDTPYIVSELLEGKTLRARLGNNALPVPEAAEYALQIVHGLIAAHERHIVHRDLKPENLFITHDGRVKILDFGVAKLQAPVEGDRSMAELTTVTKRGMIVGTVAYMSPEQLRAQPNRPVDHRSDIFSFGGILFEMLTGHRAFSGETAVDTMTAVLKEEPPVADLDQAAVPAAYQEIVKHCLEKEADNRFQSAKDLAFALQTVSPAPPKPVRGRKFLLARTAPWAIAGIMAAGLLILAVLLARVPLKPAYKQLTFEAGTVYAARFSSDGQNVVYSAAWNGKPVQVFSTVGGSLPQALQFADASLLAISRDNDLALVLHGAHTAQLETANGTLASAPLAGGAPRELLPEVRWADWDGDRKLAAVHYVEGQSRLEYPLGTVLYQTSGWISNIRFSPKHDLIAFMEHPRLWDNRGNVCVIDLQGHVRSLTPEWESESGLAWSPDGKEIWFTASKTGVNLSLRAVDLNGKLREVFALPLAITLQDIAADGRVLVALNSRRYALGYTTLGGKVDADLSWHDWNSARDISPDGKFVLFEDSSEAAGPGYAVVVRNVDGSLPVSLGEGSSGGLSPDGKWAISISTQEPRQITLLPVGAGQARTISITGLDHIHHGWARFLPDGQRIALVGDQSGPKKRCYVADISDGKAKPVTPEGVLCGPLSPDGRSLVGNAPGRSIAIYSLDGGEPQPMPSVEKNFTPVQWSSDGKALYGYHLGEFPSRVYRIEIATGKETWVQELKPSAPAGVVVVMNVVVSRDGQKFAYSYNQTLSVLWVISGLN